VRGDVLTLTVSGAAVALNRVKPETGAGSVHQELAGKWCRVSVTNANQGARQSSQCITLKGNGAYAYVGGSDSYNPYGGATSQSARGKVTTYRLEKRNHPREYPGPDDCAGRAAVRHLL
jgi:hypothetical protein